MTMSQKITNTENISELESMKKSKLQEIWKVTVNSIKDILTQNWEDVILTDEQIQDIIDDKENCDWIDRNDSDKKYQYDNIRIIVNYLKNLDRSKMKDFIRRKVEYLEKNKTISKEKFEELFWWSWKFWKTEINQTDMWLCFMYSWIELLKKSNWFDELIQTHLKETSQWWEVKLPMWDINGYWFKVNKHEIDQKINRYWKYISINSESNLLWFKILEIACIKKVMYDKFTNGPKRRILGDLLKAKNEFSEKWDFELNGELIERIWDSNDAISYMKNLFWNSIISHRVDYSAKSYDKDYAFNAFQKWLCKITLMFEWDNDKIKDIKVFGYQKKNSKRWSIVSYDSWWKWTKFIGWHVYSIERCYTNPATWEKRVWIINPWYTWYKFDVSLENCKQNFSRDVIWIDIDKMFC